MKIHSLAIAAIVLALSACSAFALGMGDNVHGNGKVRLEQRDVRAFTGIENRGSGFVRFSQGPTWQLTVEADTNILPYIETDVTDGILVLRTRQGVSVDPTRLVFRITAPELSSIGIKGSGDFRLETPVETDSLGIAINGSGRFEGSITVADLDVDINGSGGVTLEGSAKAARHAINGSGSIEAGDLSSANARVVINGSGSVSLSVTGTLDVDISGSGDVNYHGGAKATVRSSGSGTVKEY